MQFFKPENNLEVRKALEEAGRIEFIGSGCEALIPAHPPKEALQARREQAKQTLRGDHVHTVPNPPAKKGYRPGRATAPRQQKRSKGP